jgi:SAM-dependent methyltransferase
VFVNPERCVVANSQGGLAGRGFLQSPAEWAARNRILAESLSRLAERHYHSTPHRGLDVGCQQGALADYFNAHTSMQWEGIDPALTSAGSSPEGTPLYPAAADNIPYPNCYFDCLILANVFEHIPPEQRHASFVEMYRVLRPSSILVGQLPNPYFPIESHSRLPFMGWLPVKLQKKYWRLSPTPWEHDFFVVTLRHLRAEAEAAGFHVTHVNNFNYPSEALPKSARPIAAILKRPMRRFPWAWQFVLRRPE